MLAPQMQTPRTNGASANTKPDALDSIAVAEYEPAVIASTVTKLWLAKHHVDEGPHGDFLVSKYGLSKYCSGASELHAFAVKLGVKP